MICSSPKAAFAWFAVLCVAAASGCGGGSASGPSAELLKPGEVSAEVIAAENVNLAQFPQVEGRSIDQLTKAAAAQGQFGQGNGTFNVGENRLAFAVIGPDDAPAYGPTVVYVADSRTGVAKGPFAAPADPMVPQQKFESKQSSIDSNAIQAIYETKIPLTKIGTWTVLSLTQTPSGLVGAEAGTIKVAAKSTVPNVGDKAPVVHTSTGTSAASGSAVDTRDPKAPSLHQTDFAAARGTSPVALMFSSPQFCVSRVCGPATDLLLQLQATYGTAVTAIQQEAYAKFPKPAVQMQQFGLVAADGSFSEPWLFTVRKDGTIAARLEGAFGINAMNAAFKAALR